MQKEEHSKTEYELFHDAKHCNFSYLRWLEHLVALGINGKKFGIIKIGSYFKGSGSL